MNSPRLSVILCTHNPRPDLFLESLAALSRQTLPQDQWELLVIDNASDPAVAIPPDFAALPARVIPEPAVGLNHARRTGIRAARADLLVFVDDDNLLDPDYLATALRIADDNPRYGAFGGVCLGRIEGPPLPRWKQRLVDKLGVRDNGPQPLASYEDKWGPWEPIGAGLVCRRSVGEEFARIMDSVPEAQRLDRSGKGLMSGGDTLIARCSYRLGLGCAYDPALRLTHVIKAGRLETAYLRRILTGHGRSVVVLNRVLGLKPHHMSALELALRLPYRLFTRGLRGSIIYCWDIGYFRECRGR